MEELLAFLKPFGVILYSTKDDWMVELNEPLYGGNTHDKPMDALTEAVKWMKEYLKNR